MPRKKQSVVTVQSLAKDPYTARKSSMEYERSYVLTPIFYVQWIPFVLRKTLFDFIKSCGSQIRLKFSEVAYRSTLFPEIKKEMNLAPKIGFS